MASIGSTNIKMEVIVKGIGIVLAKDDLINKNLIETILMSEEVPSNKIWRINYIELCCRGHITWKVKIDNYEIGGGMMNAIKCKDRVDFPDILDASSGKKINVVYLYSYGPEQLPIKAYVGLSEISAI